MSALLNFARFQINGLKSPLFMQTSESAVVEFLALYSTNMKGPDLSYVVLDDNDTLSDDWCDNMWNLVAEAGIYTTLVNLYCADRVLMSILGHQLSGWLANRQARVKLTKWSRIRTIWEDMDTIANFPEVPYSNGPEDWVNNLQKIQRVSPFTGKINIREIDITEAQLRELHSQSRRHIQQICPKLSAEDREFLLSGRTQEDWDAMFASSPKR